MTNLNNKKHKTKCEQLEKENTQLKNSLTELTHDMELLKAFLMENPEQVQNLGKNEKSKHTE